MSLFVFDEDGLGSAEQCALATQVFERACAVIGQEGVSAELTLVDEATIRDINRETRGVDAVTDVLSFPSLDGVSFPVKIEDFPWDLDPETGRLTLGEIVLCMARMREQAKEYGHGEKREFAYLIAHGCMHLFGYDHVTDEEKAVMRAKEEEVMARLNIPRDLT